MNSLIGINHIVLDVLVFMGIAAGLVAGVIIRCSSFFRSTTNNFFAYAIFVLVLLNFFGWLETDFLELLYLSQLMWEYLFPALLLIYFLKALNLPMGYSSKIYWFFVPFIVSTVFRTVFDLDFKFGWYNLPFEATSLLVIGFDSLDYSLAFLYNIVLVVWSYALILTNERISHNYKKWLKRLCIFVFILLAAWFLLEYVEVILGWNYWIVLWLTISIFFFWSVYYGLFKLRLFDQRAEIHARISSKHRVSSGLINKTARGDQYSIRLQQLMEQEELFKDPNLSRDVVSEKLGVSSGYLSQLVNDLFECGFVDYVNKYRVEAAKIMLHDPDFDKYSIQAIGMEAGFKSKSAFYNTFQKFTEITPGKYKAGSGSPDL